MSFTRYLLGFSLFSILFISAIWLILPAKKDGDSVQYIHSLTELKAAGNKDFWAKRLPLDRQLYLLGESTHGTKEYYSLRDQISRQLIEGSEIGFIAVEGDWDSLYQLNLYIHGKSSAANARTILRRFDRWPTWMWANGQVEEMIEWLREYNQRQEQTDRISFYGMDVYGQWDALDFLMNYAQKSDQQFYQQLTEKYECFARHRPNEWNYAQSLAQNLQDRNCGDRVAAAVGVVKNYLDGNHLSHKKSFRLLQSAYVIKNAESFYRLSALGNSSADSWNARAIHMSKTVERLLEHHQRAGIVWAHNTHVGDARATDMRRSGQVNIGQLSRENHGKEQVYILGFSTYQGHVFAGSQWGSARMRMEIPSAHPESFDYLLSEIAEHLNINNFFMTFHSNIDSQNAFFERGFHRAIGVVYNPRAEQGNYVPTVMGERYDAIIFIHSSHELDTI